MKTVIIVAILTLAVAVAAPARADDDRPEYGPRWQNHPAEQYGNHPDRLREGDRRHDRIEDRLERKAERIEQRYEQRAKRAEARGNDELADRLRAKGKRLVRQLEHKQDRFESRHDRAPAPFWARHPGASPLRYPGWADSRLAWRHDAPRYGHDGRDAYRPGFGYRCR